MNRRWHWGIVLVLLGTLYLGCGGRDDARFYVRFQDATGIQIDDPVKNSGIVIGRVAGPTAYAPEGGGVLVPVVIDQLPDNLRPQLNQHVGITVDRATRQPGQPHLNVRFSNREGERLSEGAIVNGLNSSFELAVWQAAHTGTLDHPRSIWENLFGLVFKTDRAAIGLATYYFNIVSFWALIAIILALLVDLLVLTMKDPGKPHSSPLFLRLIWKVFALVVVVRVAAFIIYLVAGLLNLTLPDLSPYIIYPENEIECLRWEWRFVLAAIAIFAVKLRFGLFAFFLKR